MKTRYSKEFEKTVRKLSGKTLNSVRNTILEVKNASCLEEISDCKKLVDFDNVYRIRIGRLRAFFIFHIEIVNDYVFFKYLIPRGEAYDKKNTELLRKADKQLCPDFSFP